MVNGPVSWHVVVPVKGTSMHRYVGPTGLVWWAMESKPFASFAEAADRAREIEDAYVAHKLDNA